MRIAYIGLKGLPGTFSGIETHVHELGTRLVRRGHEITAYVRPQYTPWHVRGDDGIKLAHLPTIGTKHLDATVHSFFAALHAIAMDYDVVHFHTIGPGCFSLLSRLSRARVVITIHRLDYLSAKWGRFARTCLQLAEQISLRVPHATIVVAPFLQAHYQQLGYKTEYIPNGVAIPPEGIGMAHIRELGLEPNQYVLFLGRLVPEKRPDWAIRAFLNISDNAMRLVIAGGSSATDRYVRDLKQLAEATTDRILFTDAVYGPLKDELFTHARVFVLPSALEGLPITLLEAMSYGRPCLVSDLPPHQDIIQDGENGFLHRTADFAHLCERLSDVLSIAPSDLVGIGEAAKATVTQRYNWEMIVDQTEHLYEIIRGSAQLAQLTHGSSIAHERPMEEL
jgi:glycosyltransferase involved in cell wall biosynthesis